MTNRKGQNSILFVATLGVYLGLMLAGATPQAVAQQRAAMTRNFDIRDEIEYCDELDNKPDSDPKELAHSLDSYFSELGSFVENLQKLLQIDKFNPDFQTFNTDQLLFAPCPETGGEISDETNGKVDEWLLGALTDAKNRTENWTWLADCNPTDKFKLANRTKAKSAGLSIHFDKTELKYEISVARSGIERANGLFHGLSNAFSSIDTAELSDREKVLLKHTELNRFGNQVFIVTRLPRGSLDALLATNAK